MFRMNAYGVGRNPHETAWLCWPKERRHTKNWDALGIRQRLRPFCGFARCRNWFGLPGFDWSCALRCAHSALTDVNARSLAKAQQTKPSY